MRAKNDKNSLLAANYLQPLAHAGFTLIELLVVIFIISLMVAVSLPSFTDILHDRTTTEAKRLASVIRYVNDTAVTTKENSHIKVIFRDRTLSYKTQGEDKSLRFETISGVKLQSRGMVREGEVIISFGPAGAGESFSIYLEDEKESLRVDFNALSGRVKITNDEKTIV